MEEEGQTLTSRSFDGNLTKAPESDYVKRHKHPTANTKANVTVTHLGGNDDSPISENQNGEACSNIHREGPDEEAGPSELKKIRSELTRMTDKRRRQRTQDKMKEMQQEVKRLTARNEELRKSNLKMKKSILKIYESMGVAAPQVAGMAQSGLGMQNGYGALPLINSMHRLPSGALVAPALFGTHDTFHQAALFTVPAASFAYCPIFATRQAVGAPSNSLPSMQIPHAPQSPKLCAERAETNSPNNSSNVANESSKNDNKAS